MSREYIVVVLSAIAIAGIAAFVLVSQSDLRGGGEIVIQGDPANARIAVWVDGAVASPGVYTLVDGARLADAVAAAGGLNNDADLTSLNLAARLTDEQHIVIPGQGAAAVASPGGALSVAAVATAAGGKIDINHADAAALDKLPGIGPVLASRIVSYRETNGPFARIEELARVDGISPAMVEDLRDLITANP